ncbi:uncharacterized protein TNCV_3559291 [Trichonephila clavipes]|uniref:Uncharacterized protein n=1 Tax=Trichonephila clavipes TaxID=2585209 RepID=A0A8X6WDX0_TRICX|nr:uncharacterized protein TNCV_3559291 [Trichonephila clavipes]
MCEDACVRTCQPDYIWSEKLKDFSIADVGALPFSALPLLSTQIGSLSKQILSSETKKKSLGVKSGEYGTCSSTRVRLSAKYRFTDSALWAGSLSWCKIHELFFHNSGYFLQTRSRSVTKTDKYDEAHFWLNGYVNKQNCRIWSEANPQVYVETPLHPEKLTVWYALWTGGIIGP